MSKTISFGLSVSEVNQAIKELEQYKIDLNRKVELYCKQLSEIGLEKAKSVMSRHKSGSGESLGSARIEVNSVGELVSMSIVVESEVILFLEFGSGVTYNSEAHPKASELGYGVGTYPGQTHAFDPNGWWYQDDDGEWKHSYGIKADMPMFKASTEMATKAVALAKKVFKVI